MTIPFPPGVDKVRLRAVEYAAYGPARHSRQPGGMQDMDDPLTKSSAINSVKVGQAPGVSVNLFAPGDKDVPLAEDAVIERDPTMGAAARIGYHVRLHGLYMSGSGASPSPVASPVFDSIQVSYFLPREEVVLFEKVVE
jgi:hypothetical protein